VRVGRGGCVAKINAAKSARAHLQFIKANQETHTSLSRAAHGWGWPRRRRARPCRPPLGHPVSRKLAAQSTCRLVGSSKPLPPFPPSLFCVCQPPGCPASWASVSASRQRPWPPTPLPPCRGFSLLKNQVGIFSCRLRKIRALRAVKLFAQFC
jgi:hypothetical protein